MIVSEKEMRRVVSRLKHAYKVGFDTETTGLRPFHGDRIFSLALVFDLEGMRSRYYFNFNDYGHDVPGEWVLDKKSTFATLQAEVFSRPQITWFAHNAKFDLHMLAREDCEIAGPIHCTKANGRVVYNEHTQYDLDSSLERIGLAKDDAVEAYIMENNLWDWEQIPGRKARRKNKYYYKVPFDIMSKYALTDAEGTLCLGLSQEEEVARLDSKLEPQVPPLFQVLENEKRLTKTVLRMEQVGCRIDRPYCERAVEFFSNLQNTTQAHIEKESGLPFKNSPKCLEQIFDDQKEKFSFTEKGGLSFDTSALGRLDHAMVAPVIQYRMAKNSLDFFSGFLYHADENDIVHPSFNPDVARHGRFSSSNPNFQNLTSEESTGEEEETQFYVRRAIIPREGNLFLMPDYKSMEYKMMLEYACGLAGHTVKLAEMVNSGVDFHDATVELVKAQGYDITRKKAKIANFLTLYEGGPKALSSQLGCTYEEAQEIRNAINKACPEAVKARIQMITTAKLRGYVYNWFGRRCWFPVSKWAYRAPNYIDSGGCADIMKIAMNEMDFYLMEKKKKSRMVCTIHDELVIDCPKDEALEVAKTVAMVMSAAFPAKYVPMTVDMEYSEKSLHEKVEGYPT